MTTLTKMSEPPAEWLNAQDVASRYRLPIQTVWRMTREGRLNGKRITAKVTLYRAPEVERALGLTDADHEVTA